MGEASDEQTMRCPVCRARQQWSESCRRCGADLSLLREIAGSSASARDACLAALREGRPYAALNEARRLHRLHPAPASRRLVLMCRLACGWGEAITGSGEAGPWRSLDAGDGRRVEHPD